MQEGFLAETLKMSQSSSMMMAAAGTQNDTGEDAGVWLESERVAAERESALERERERETEETEIRFLYSQMDAIQRKLDWVTRERP